MNVGGIVIAVNSLFWTGAFGVRSRWAGMYAAELTATIAIYRWQQGTLYDCAGADVDVSIYQMLDRAESPRVILEVLQHSKDHEYINENKFRALVREVKAITSRVVDQGSL
eukprot:930618-Karenia_brevis.AAC.1